MATALACGLVRAQIVPAGRLSAADPAEPARQRFAEATGGKVFAESGPVVADADVLFLAVKPQALDEAAGVLATELGKQTPPPLIISILAGVSLARLTAALAVERIIRVMPNTPCLVGCGASGICSPAGLSKDDVALAQRLMSAVGLAVRVSESQMHALTALSGSGPAYVYQVIEALSDAGVREGLPRELATQLAAATVRGAAEMVLQTGEHPAALKDSVASPAGTTIAGLAALEEYGLRSALIAAVGRAAERSREMEEE